MDIKKEREKITAAFLEIAEDLIELNYPFIKNINSNSGVSASITLDKKDVLKKFMGGKNETIKEFLKTNPKLKCVVLGSKYMILELEK
jgi:hypothetical protein